MSSDLIKIGVIADTHNHLPSSVPQALSAMDEIWHLGDVCDSSTLDPLIALGKPLKIVRGNNDFEFDWPLTLDLKRGGVNFRLVHIPPTSMPDVPNLVVLHGHTHVPRNEMVRGVRYLNPGSVGRANKGAPASFAYLDVLNGEIKRWELFRVCA